MAGGWRRGLGVAAAALGLLVVSSQVHGWLPGEREDPGSDPFVRTGDVGDEIDLRTATLTVDSVEGAGTVLEFGSEKVSPGLWVVAHYTVVAKRENTSVTFAELEDAEGRIWALVGRNDNACTESPPGVPVHCSVHLEVPADALPSLRLRLARESADTRYDVVAEVDLGLTEDDVARFEAAEPIELQNATVGGGTP